MAARVKRGAAPATEAEPSPTDPTGQTQDALEGRERGSQRSPEARLSRKSPTTGSWGLLFRGPVERVTQPWVQEVFGGGEYKTEVYGTREDGSFGYLRGELEMFTIDESIPFKGPLQGRVQSGPLPPLRGEGGASPDDDMQFLVKNQVIEMMKDQADARTQTAMMMMNMMKTMSESSAAMITAISQMASATRTAPITPDSGTKELLLAIVPALVGKKDSLESALAIAQAIKGNGPAIGGLGDLETILEVADRINRRGNGEDISFTGVLKENLPQALGVLEKLAARNQPAPAPVRMAPPAPRPAIAPGPVTMDGTGRREVAPPADELPPTGPAPVADEWTPIEGAMQQLLGFARKGADPFRVVQTALLFANDEQKARLREIVARPHVADEIVARFPEFQAFPAWLGDFLGELHAEFYGDPADDGDDDDEPQPGADAPAGEPTE